MASGRSMLEKAVLALQHLAARGGDATEEDVRRALRLSVPAAKGLLGALRGTGLASYDRASGSYGVGPVALRLSAQIRNATAIERVARPILRELVADTGETVTLNAYVRDEGVGLCVAIEDSPKPLQYALEIGETKLLHAGASGKTILAFLPEEERAAVLGRHGLPRVTRRTVTGRARLQRDLAAIRRQGYCISKGERLEGAVGIGVPVFDAEGRVAASLLVTLPAGDYRPHTRRRLLPALKRHARRLSAALGYR